MEIERFTDPLGAYDFLRANFGIPKRHEPRFLDDRISRVNITIHNDGPRFMNEVILVQEEDLE